MSNYARLSALSLGERLKALGPCLASALLIVALGIQAGAIATDDTGPISEARSSGASQGRTVDPQSEITAVTRAHLFGQSAAPADATHSPLTAAPLILTGVLAAQTPNLGMAIIGPSVTSVALCRVGASLPGGVRLDGVYSDHVLLDRGGSIEALYLPTLSSIKTATDTRSSAAIAPGQRLLNFARNNSAVLSGLARVQPFFNGGRLSGYRLFPSHGGAPGLARLGLQPGDLIMAVNGTTLDDPNHANEVLHALSSSSSATVTILRGGVEQEVNLSLDDLAAEAETAVATEESSGRALRASWRLGGLSRDGDPAAFAVQH